MTAETLQTILTIGGALIAVLLMVLFALVVGEHEEKKQKPYTPTDEDYEETLNQTF